MIKMDPKVFALATSGKIDDLKVALQHAIELEHATMPPYLYARFSLGRDNRDISGVLRRIVLQEMLHMLLAGNLLKAIGGSPVIDRKEFVPDYPTHLPGTVAKELVVPLKPFSQSLVKQTFMRIEQPEHVLKFRTLALDAEEPPPETIGEFYRRIRQIFEKKGREIIVDKTGATQPHTDRFTERQIVTSAKEAMDAIDIIVEQGEGTETDPFFPAGTDVPDKDRLAHYYRFAELVKGRLKRNPDAPPNPLPEEKYIYDSKDPVPFNETRVLRLPENPKTAHYPEGSNARSLSNDFNRLYTRVLKLLHQAFNGSPDRLGDAINLMTDLSTAGRTLTDVDLGNGMHAGPTFEYLP
jgi:Ferritin-like